MSAGKVVAGAVPEFVVLPGGRYRMGGEEGDKFVTDVERPRHEVVIAEGLWMGKYPVTSEELRGGGGTVPAVRVTWDEAVAYAAWVGEEVGGTGRLASEAEWEWAARAGTGGAAAVTVETANFLYNEEGRKVGRNGLSEVGAFGCNGFGLADLQGNVCEWTADTWHPSYDGAPCDGSAWIEAGCPARVIRGGAWDHIPSMLRVSSRDRAEAKTRRDNLGFRVVVEGGTAG